MHLNEIVGYLDEPSIERRVHALEHAGAVETVQVGADDLARRRLRLRGDHGSDVAIALPRGAVLRDGAVLYLDEQRALVLRTRPREWLRLRARDAESALQLGFLAGHLHWRVEFDGDCLCVAPDGDASACMARIEARLAPGAVEVVREAPTGGANGD